MPITHKPKAGALLTGTEWEGVDTHEGTVIVDHDDLTGVQADQHHDQSHTHNGGDGSGTVAHSATTGKTADDHHAQLHAATHATGQPDALTAANVGAAPSTVDYLVGTASAGLSGEIAVGTTPGGELGNTWASPTVDASHSGSTHAATQAAAEATASGALTTHAGAADPHTGYRLESADHSHATTGLQAGQLAQANTHQSPDTDSGTSSLHHTIGTSATQAAAGDHTHTTLARVVLKTADETVNNSAVLQNDDVLKFAVAASEKWQFECDIYYTTGGVPDLKTTWVGPSGSTIIWSPLGKDSGNTTLDTTGAVAGAATQTGAGVSPSMAHQRHMGVISNGATPGDLQLQWSQNTQNSSDTIIHALSSLRLIKLA
jgi:hypothetical protein